MTDTEKEKCLKCLKPKTKSGGGLVTQFIDVCRCEEIVFASEQQEDSQPICKECGKRVNPGRAGSMSQWIFRSDICCCNQPKLTTEPERPREPKRCWRCKRLKSKADGDSQTVTSELCDCLPVDLDSEQQTTAIQMCVTCGKRINIGRSGSMSQWIFRAEICSCEWPNLSKHLPQPKEQIEDYDNQEEALEEELPLDPGSFPTERYKPIGELGTGGSGAIYLCRDRLLNKKVAVKILHALTPEQLIAFQEEAKATSKLSHPNIIQVLDFGATESGVPFMVMEHVVGASLEFLLDKHGPLDAETAVHVLSCIANALEYAHSREILHRDIKPSNIILTEKDGIVTSVKLIDFGAAKVKESTGIGTQIEDKTLVGTPSYMPPDMVMGAGYESSSEIYSLGCVFFEAVTGRAPFQSESALETLSMHVNEPCPELIDYVDEQFKNDLEDFTSLDLLFKRCMEKKQADRIQSMGELKRAISGIDFVSSNEPMHKEEEQITPAAEQIVFSDEQSKTLPPFVKVSALSILLVVVVGGGVFLFSKLFTKEELKKKSTGSDFTEIASDLKSQMESIKFHVQEDNGQRWHVASFVTDEDLAKLHEEDVEYLDITGSVDVSDKGIEHLVKLRLKGLSVGETSISDRGMNLISRMTTLEELFIERCGGISDEGLKGFSKLKNLYSLVLGSRNDWLTDDAIPYLGKIPNLSLLDLNGTTQLKGRNLSQLNQLTDLDLSRCRIEGIAYSQLARLSRLESLYLDSNRVGDTEIAQIRKMKLKLLDLSRTNITPEGLKLLTAMKTLKVLRIRECRNLTKSAVVDFRKKLPSCRVVLLKRKRRDFTDRRRF